MNPEKRIEKITQETNTRPLQQAKPTDNIFSQNKYSVLQASKLMGIGQSTLRRIIHAQEIPVIWVGGKILLIERDIEAYLQSHYGSVQDTPKSQFTKSKLPPLPDSVKNSKFFRRAS